MAKLESMVSLLIAVRDHLATVDDEALATVDDDWLVSTMRQSLTRHGWRYSDIGSDEVGVIFEDVVDAHKSKLHELRETGKTHTDLHTHPQGPKSHHTLCGKAFDDVRAPTKDPVHWDRCRGCFK